MQSDLARARLREKLQKRKQEKEKNPQQQMVENQAEEAAANNQEVSGQGDSNNVGKQPKE